MKTFQTLMIRILLGLLCLALLVTALFQVTLLVIPIWGATKAEVALALPGDELTSNPDLLWTNAITIDASPEDVWPWIAQIGDDRGGFYSYTFIENKVGELMGDAGYDVTYTNANEIHPEWQNPQPDLPIIQKSLKIREYKPGEYMLADSIQPRLFCGSGAGICSPLTKEPHVCCVALRLTFPKPLAKILLWISC